MAKPSIKTVAVVGTGVIGRSWIQVFARAGCTVRVYDRDPKQLAAAMAWFVRDLKDQRERGLLKKKEQRAWRDRVTAVESLEAAVGDVGFVQESGPEDVELKRAMYLEIDAVAHPKAILGSSTSAIDMTEIANGVPGARRCIVTHPVNPPHVVPAVEILGGAETDPKVVRKTIEFMKEIGQTPILMHRFAPGFVINRMQAALIREAIDLVASGVCDPQAVDDSIRDGLGLRWALMGPYGVANTNADGGVREYFTRYRPAYHGLWADLNTNVQMNDELVGKLGDATDRFLTGSLEAQRTWRDRLVLAIRALKRDNPPPSRARRRGRR